MSNIEEAQPTFFYDEVDSDPRIIYHGTSLVNAASIERRRFRADAHAILVVDHIRKVREIYETMN